MRCSIPASGPEPDGHHHSRGEADDHHLPHRRDRPKSAPPHRPRHALARQVRHRRGDLPPDRHPLRAPRPGAARRGRHQAEPARPQRPAVQPRAGLADVPRRRRARPAAARPDHRRGAEHADDRRRRRRALGLRSAPALGLVAGYGPKLGRHRDHAAGRRDHVVPVAAARGDRALHAVALGRERDPRPRDHPHPDLPAHHPRRGAGDQGADVRAGGAGDGRLVAPASSSATSCRW